MDGADIAVAADPILAGRVDISGHGPPPNRAGTPLRGLPSDDAIEPTPAPIPSHSTPPSIVPKAEKLEQLPSFLATGSRAEPAGNRVQDWTVRPPIIWLRVAGGARDRVVGLSPWSFAANAMPPSARKVFGQSHL